MTPDIRIERGDPSPDEVAALVAVLAGLSVRRQERPERARPAAWCAGTRPRNSSTAARRCESCR
ncbi:acyl-CoA carboxylase subunit epsilon [Lentzea sp. NPDC058436]|uniref:acyl-CoA carboxylase subunit epsilon n=1 Tax=Lentzea sp. NPDC058436 TaxID=3346499 RepID=UPI00365D3DFA